MPKVAVIGAAGFAGALCAKLIWEHPEFELAEATARSDAGVRIDKLYPQHQVPLELKELDIDRLAGKVDAALLAYPHKAAAPVAGELLEAGIRVVDLSADFRLSQVAYEAYYQPHERPDLLERAAYGLTEFHRDEVRTADLVANPGCYPTAALLGLMPIADLIEDVIVDAKSGVSGAGRAPSDKTHFVAVTENISPYGVEGHRHRAELEMELAGGTPITFTPHLLPVDQGLLASCYIRTERPIEKRQLKELFERAYADEPFIRLVDTPPGVRDVRETNDCAIHATIEPATGRVLVFSAIDNLWKGAAGQAVQNLNLMFGLPETAGLKRGIAV